jgi:hypothetical protein
MRPCSVFVILDRLCTTTFCATELIEATAVNDSVHPRHRIFGLAKRIARPDEFDERVLKSVGCGCLVA